MSTPTGNMVSGPSVGDVGAAPQSVQQAIGVALKLDSFQVWSELFKLMSDNAKLLAGNTELRRDNQKLAALCQEYKHQILQFCADHPQDSPTHPFPEVLQAQDMTKA